MVGLNLAVFINNLNFVLHRYLVDECWFKRLNLYLARDSSSIADRKEHPGPIDNSALFKADPDEPGELREHMIDELDFTLVPEDVWFWLVQEFSIAQDREPIARKVILKN